jgi:hypothetical protein
MRGYRFALAIVLMLPVFVVAAEPSDVLRYVPKQADAALIVDRPRQLADALIRFEPLRQLAAFEAIKEQLDSTNSKRFINLIAYYEKALGKSWPELLDTLAGGGACLAVHFAGDQSPALFVMKSTDEALLHKALDLVITVAKQELERTESTVKFHSVEYRGYTGYQLGKDAFAAVCGPVLFFSNKSEAVKLGIDLYINGAQESLAGTGHTDAARKLLPAKPVAWIFGNTTRLHEMPDAQQAYRYPKGDIGQLALFQGITDVLGKSPFVAIGTYPTDDGFRTAIRMPAGRDATPDGLALHLPPAGQPASLPLLEPNGVLFSMSFFLDLGKVWSDREKLLAESTRKEIEGADQRLGRFLGGRKLADVLTSVGTHHRLVVVHQAKAGYTKQPDQLQPAIAFISDFKNPDYASAMNAILRTTAIVAGTQAKLKYKEENIGDVKLVTYRFVEDAALANDTTNARFNASPCFAKVGNQFFVASTVELGRELIDLLQKPEAAASSKTTLMRAYAAGGATLLKAIEEQLLTQTILDRATTVDEAKKEAARFVDWVRNLGNLQFEIEYGPSEFQFDIRMKNSFSHTPPKRARSGDGQ